MINCLHPNCDACKHNPCILKSISCNKDTVALEKEISFEVKQLQEIRREISNCLTSNDYYTRPYSLLIQLEYDTVEIIRELRKELQEVKV